MGNRHDPVSVFKAIQQASLFDLLRNKPGDRTRAIHRGQDANKTAGANLTVTAVIAVEVVGMVWFGKLCGLNAKLMCLIVVSYAQIMAVDMGAFGDVSYPLKFGH